MAWSHGSLELLPQNELGLPSIHLMRSRTQCMIRYLIQVRGMISSRCLRLGNETMHSVPLAALTTAGAGRSWLSHGL